MFFRKNQNLCKFVAVGDSTAFNCIRYKCRGGPRSIMVTLLTLKQEVRGSNPGAAPPKFGAQTHLYLASRLQRCFKGPLPPKKSHVGMVQAECRAPRMTKKRYKCCHHTWKWWETFSRRGNLKSKNVDSLKPGRPQKICFIFFFFWYWEGVGFLKKMLLGVALVTVYLCTKL